MLNPNHLLKTALFVACAQTGWSAGPATAVKRWEATLQHSFAGQPKPKFDRGLFIAPDAEGLSFAMYNAAGRPLGQYRVAIPDSTRTSIADVGVSPSGTVVVAGGAMTSAGQVVNFVAWLSPDGTAQKTVRVSPFVALKICVAPDGAVWAAGREFGGERRTEVRAHAVLRRFTAEGTLTHSVLSREAFAGGQHPALRRSSLSCGSDRVGFFSYSTNEWVEISASGEVLGRWKGLDLGAAVKPNGIAMTGDGTVFASAYKKFTPDATPEGFLYRLDRATGSWFPVGIGTAFGGPAAYAEIVGTDASNLVLASTLPTFVAVHVE